MRKKILSIYAALLAVGIPYYILFSFTGWGFECPLYKATGLLCGTCGISHMFVSMMHFRFAEAFHYNMLAFVLFFVWNLIALLAFINKPSFFRNKKFLTVCFNSTAASLVVFMILRNVF